MDKTKQPQSAADSTKPMPGFDEMSAKFADAVGRVSGGHEAIQTAFKQSYQSLVNDPEFEKMKQFEKGTCAQGSPLPCSERALPSAL